MKKGILLVLAPLLLFSCKKESKPSTGNISNGGNKYKVRFNVSGFKELILGSAGPKHTIGAQSRASVRAGTVAADTLTLYYLVYDSNNNLVSKAIEPSDSLSFAPINDNLAAGTYQVYFVAGQKGMTVHYNAPDVAGNFANDAYFTYIQGGQIVPWGDTFYNSLTLTVSSSNISQNVTLQRTVGQLEVDITDAVPDNIQKISVTIQSEYGYAYVSNAVPFSLFVYAPINYSYTSGQNNRPQSFLTLMENTKTPFNVIVQCYDTAGNLVAEAMANNVTCAKNTRTIVSGSLFNGTNNGLTVSLNDQWDPNPTTIDF